MHVLLVHIITSRNPLTSANKIINCLRHQKDLRVLSMVMLSLQGSFDGLSL